MGIINSDSLEISTFKLKIFEKNSVKLKINLIK